MKVQIKDVMLKELPDGGVIAFEKSAIPLDAKVIEQKRLPAIGKSKAKANGADATNAKGKL